ncbi:MAG: methyltransferase domain-containing protein [Rhodocyclaceae bacterium]|nr:methyltransferase domain-containing protein [Rhodocyclaceae bacterium]
MTIHSARTILSIVLDALPPVHSAVDFGCGVGTWLSVLRENGAEDIRGLDGPWVDPDLLQIPRQDFQTAHFEKTVVTERRYDLAISLEVAEHIPAAHAGSFVDSLTGAADMILFSAAIPFQGGVGHVNEQWPAYWGSLFAERGYAALDIVRRRIWDDDEIPFWYRQNVLLFVKRDRLPEVAAGGTEATEPGLPIALVHPDLYLARMHRP